MSTSNLLKNIRNLLPYFLLIGIYFCFINLEARKELDNIQNSEKDNYSPNDESGAKDQNLRIKIPVIPYNQ